MEKRMSNETRTETATVTPSTNDTDHTLSSTPPPLHFTFHPLKPSLYLAFLIFCNVLIPCLLYYLLLIYTKLTQKEVVGISSAALGLSSCFDSPFRLWKLVKHRKLYGPLGSDKWWHLDFFMWLYTIALLVFAFPLAIAPAIPSYNFFLMSTPMLIAPVGLVFLLSLVPLRYPFWLSSDPPRTPNKPAVYYILEDIPAVDFVHGREWRQAIKTRYEASPLFRALMWNQTLYWALMIAVEFGSVAAVVWTAPFHSNFGTVLGFFFFWAFVAGLGSWGLARWGVSKEYKAWGEQRGKEWS